MFYRNSMVLALFRLRQKDGLAFRLRLKGKAVRNDFGA
jgi:hypothetical protein